ncbi:MAG: hypothetical protein ACUVTZ_06315 [Armatimonadota bacterium]
MRTEALAVPPVHSGSDLLDLAANHPGVAPWLPQRLQHVLALAKGEYERELVCRVAEGWCPPSAALVLLAAGVGRPDASRCAKFACGMEMVWQAVVQHRSAALGRLGVESVLSSDFLLSRALSLFIFDGDSEVMHAVVDGAVALAESVLAADMQGASAAAVAEGIARYWGACSRVGAAAGCLPMWHVDRLEAMVRQAAGALCGDQMSLRGVSTALSEGERELLQVLDVIAERTVSVRK